MRRLGQLIAAIFYTLVVGVVPALPQAALIPNAKQTFVDENGNPLTGGKVYNYVPGTVVPKTTWSDSTQTTPNTNPVTLDAAGRGVIYGQGNYQQRVTKSDGTLVWNAPTAAYGSSEPAGATGTDTAPVGTIMPFAGITAPTNWEFSYGQALSREDYPDLYTALTISHESVQCTLGSPTLAGWPSTASMRVGAPVEGSCLPPNTVISSITNSTTIVVNNNATATTFMTGTVFPWGDGDGATTFNVPDMRGVVPAGADSIGGTAASKLQTSVSLTTTSGSSLTYAASLNTLYANMTVVGTGIPSGTTVSDLGGSVFSLTNAATASATEAYTVNAFNTVTTTSGSYSATVSDATNLAVGMYVSSANTPVDTRISRIVGTTITLTKPAIATGAVAGRYFVANIVRTALLTTSSGSPTATVDDPTGLMAGMLIDGSPSSIAAGTRIESISGRTVTMTINATATGTAAASFKATGTVTLVSGSTTVYTNVVTGTTGMIFTSQSVPVATTVSAVLGNRLVLSQAATATGTITATFQAFSSSNTIAASGGAMSNVLTQAQLPTSLGVATTLTSDPGHSHNPQANEDGANQSEPVNKWTAETNIYRNTVTAGVLMGATSTNTTDLLATSTIVNPLGGLPHPTVQPTVTMNYIIKVLPNSTGAGGVVSIGGMFGDILCGAGLQCENQTITPVATEPAMPVNPQTGLTYTLQCSDLGTLVTFNNAGGVAVTLPQPTGCFDAGFWVYLQNIGAGNVTVTPTSSTFAGQASAVLRTNEAVKAMSDGSNYQGGGLTGPFTPHTWSAAQNFNDNTLYLNGGVSGTLLQRASPISGTSSIIWPTGATDFSTSGGGTHLVRQNTLGGPLSTGVLAFTDFPLGTAGYAIMGNGASAPSYQGFTQQGTGASTRTWQDKAQETVTLLDFGADPTGVSASDTAFSNAMNYVTANSARLKVTAGTYLLNACYSTNLATLQNFVVEGDSSSVPVFNIGTSGCFFDITTGAVDAAQSQMTLRNLRIVPTGIVTNPAISFIPTGTGTTQIRNSIIEDVVIGAEYDTTGTYFSGGCADLTRNDRPFVKNFMCFGPYGPSTNLITRDISAYNVGTDQVTITAHGFKTGDSFALSANGSTLPGGLTDGTTYYIIVVTANVVQLATDAINAWSGVAIDLTGAPTTVPTPTAIFNDYRDASTRFATAFGLNLTDSYVPEVYSSHFISVDKMIDNTGTVQEGGIFVDNIGTAVKEGIVVVRTSRQPDFWIRGGQINFRDYGIKVTSAYSLWVDSVDLRQRPAAEYSTDPSADIYCDDCWGVVLQNNIHTIEGEPRRRGYWLGNTAGPVLDSRIVGSIFRANYCNNSYDSCGSASYTGSAVYYGNTSNARNAMINPQIIQGSTVTKLVSDAAITCPSFMWDSVNEQNTAAALRARFLQNFCDDASAGPVFSMIRSSDTPAVNDLAGQLEWRAKTSVGTEVSYGDLTMQLLDITSAATARGRLEFNIQGGSGSKVTPLALGGLGGNPTLGFYGAVATGKPTVTGARNGNAALNDLLTELDTLGLITNSSTAGSSSTLTIASGTKALATGAISAGTCTAAQTSAATGVLTTDVISAGFNGDPTAVTGYVPSTAGMLTIISYPTADTVNFKVCNNTAGSITPGAITLNWRVSR